jgi:hypothetical protein
VKAPCRAFARIFSGGEVACTPEARSGASCQLRPAVGYYYDFGSCQSGVPPSGCLLETPRRFTPRKLANDEELPSTTRRKFDARVWHRCRSCTRSLEDPRAGNPMEVGFLFGCGHCNVCQRSSRPSYTVPGICHRPSATPLPRTDPRVFVQGVLMSAHVPAWRKLEELRVALRLDMTRRRNGSSHNASRKGRQ